MNDQKLAEILISHGVRPTQQRIAVYRFLLNNPIHPSAETVFSALSKDYPVLSKTTIYNSLNTLYNAGLIRCVTICSDEQRFDATVADHGHFLCKRCGQVFDFTVDSKAVESLSPVGYKSIQGDVYFTGYCPKCLEATK